MMPRAAAGETSFEASMWNWRPVVFVLLPFSAGYFLSYLFRTINALISAQTYR
jgi:hypothetical protein